MKTIIEADKVSFFSAVKELVRYRDLFTILAYRDYRVRYAQTYLGFVWAFIQPAMTLLIFTLVFGKAAKVDTSPVPYPLFAISGMSAWAYFSYVMSQAGGSIIAAQNMIKKIYFPKLVVPLAKCFVGVVDLIVSLVFLVVLMIIYGYSPSANFVFFPIFLLVNILAAVGVGLWLSALTVRYRDFQHIIPFMVQFGLYATPIAYPADLVTSTLPDFFKVLYYLNPMAGVVEGYRFTLIGYGSINALSGVSFLLVILIFVTGLMYFQKLEKSMPDIV